MTDLPSSLIGALADRYRIERELGQGGMATVYLAQDLRHDRKVAIKVLRPELAAVIGAERFLSEIKTTANLQHPHILPLFDSGEAGGQLFYVMPFVEGETLRDRLNREKQLPIADAIRIASEVASALDYAHRHKVIHRDIKPENILLHDGRALVADFGIALAASKAGGTRMTETGMSLGTPHYMSPEQAMGERELDARSDIYALGATTYELLTGEPPFTGPTAQAIVAKVMTATPEPVTTIRKTVPPHVAAAVYRAIQKLPADRFSSAAEFGAALTTETPVTAAYLAPAPPVGPWRMVSVGLALALAGLVGFLGLSRSSGGNSAAPTVYDAALPDSAPMTFAATTARTTYGAAVRNIAVSARADFAVYAATSHDSTSLWYRSLTDATTRQIPGTLGGTAPRISPDGSLVAFFLNDRVMVIPTAGGEARKLMDGRAAMSMEWLSPTQLVVADFDGKRFTRLDPEGGSTRSKPILRCFFGTWVPELEQWLCSYNRVAVLVDPETGARATIRTAQPDGSPGPPIAGTAFRLLDRRYLVYVSTEGGLAAAAYDPATHLIRRSVTLTTGVRREAIGEGQWDLAANGTLVYAPGVDATLGRMVSLHSGQAPRLLPVEAADFQRYDLSRNGRWLAAVVQTADLTELRIYDLRDGQHFAWLRAETIRQPLWNPTGEELLAGTIDSTRYSLLRGAPSSGVRPDTVTSVPFDPATIDATDWHDDQLALGQDWVGSIVAGFNPSVLKPVFDTVLARGTFAAVSPNAKLLVYQTPEENRVIVTSFPVPGRRWQLASDGVEPMWLSPSEVLYRAGVSWYLARLNPETGEPLGAPTFWARDPRFSDTSGWSNRPSHDGGIIYVQGPAQTSVGYLRVVPDWVAQMKAAVDAANR